ncbi:MAG: NACHT domain-containing protein, partial [Chloroflexi bacterium]|nr:NACHT domain-containing protein [Chloroflexota bacterium]
DDEVANQFAATFYRLLALGEPIDDALAQARHAIRSVCDLRGDLGWTLPVLYAATTQALIITPAPARVELPIERQHVRQQPLPGLTEGGAASLIARRRSFQHLLPGLKNGSLRTVVLAGASGSGKSVLATSLARTLAEQDLTPIPIVSRPHLPLTAARLFQICASAFTAAGLDGSDMLCDPRLTLRERLQHLVTTLNRGRFVVLLDGFDANLHPQTQTIRRPWLAVLYTHLCYHLTGGSRAIITTRVVPKDLSQLPSTVAVQQVGEMAEAAFLNHMLYDVVVERRYQQGELPSYLMREIYRRCGTSPRFLEQIRAALRQLPVEDLRALLATSSASTGAELELPTAETSPIAPLLSWLYEQLNPASQQALCRAALWDVPASLPLLAALCHVSIEQARTYTQEWHLQGLIAEVGDDLWSVPRWLRRWLLTSDRFSAEEQRAAHGELAALLSTLEHESREQTLGLSWLDCLLESRRHYLAAGELCQARALTCRLSDVLGRWGLDDDLEDLNQDLLAYELHPTPMRWIGQTYAMRGDDETARHWFERTLVVAGDRQPAAAADVWRNLAALDLKRGSTRSARLKLENALVLWQQIGDHSGEATTFAQLGVLAAQLGEPEPALRLMALSALLLRRIDHANLRHVKSWMQRLATMLGYSQLQVRCLVREVIAEYRASHGWSLIHGAFHEPDDRRYNARAA